MLKKYKSYLLLLPMIICAFVVVFNVSKSDASSDVLIDEDSSIALEVQDDVKEEIKTVKVDVKGEVNKPGVYELTEGRRVIDAINVGGGLTDMADTSLLNLSKKLSDEMVIIVYNKDKIDKIKQDLSSPKTIVEYVEKECVCPDTVNDACIQKPSVSDDESSDVSVSGKVNINTATKDVLLTVKGIGETKADAIIKYRSENGVFKSIDDIKNVSGIGESTFEKIKDNITV